MTIETLSTIKDLEALPVKIEYVAEVPSKWAGNVDQWRVTISSRVTGLGLRWHSFDYFTGLGLRTKRNSRPKKPKVADVLHSLIMDASAADANFHDWCANFGYSDDSIKAMNTYKACLEVAVALRKHFSADTLHQVRELLQDY